MRPLILALALLLSSALAGLAETTPPRTITVTGQGQVQAAPDMATITLGVVHQARTAQAAMAATSDATAAMLNTLAEAGVASRDMQTSDLALDPQWDHNRAQTGQPPAVVGFVARNTVSVRVRDLDSLGSVLDAVLQAGANSFRGLQFGLQDPDPLTDEARRNAVANARHKAALYAEAAGVTLGPLQQIRENGGAVQPVQLEVMEMARASVPVAQGEVGLNAQVTLVYAIAD
ncbi:SIMPL domain-containing protein [Actibacterium ureilyticum]|uniref:SIMPL domain-containing protein n=1 Tax=Actibacterium ureilyticum TaxID=1590614 RepID=UPI000BAAA52D|nr:SIMPL domain-containing protein [Actibacterium ureilyticum]